MTGPVLRRALRGALRQVRHVEPVPPGSATGAVADVYADLEASFGVLAPPTALHSPAPDVLMAAWLLLRESLLVADAAPRAAKEAVAAGVSRANACPYCVEVHEIALDTFGAGPESPAAAWAETTGRPGGPRVPATGDTAVELLAVATTFHYLNRIATVFLDESPLPTSVPGWARGGARRMLGGRMRTREPVAPGDLAARLPGAPLPDDLAWAAPHRRLATTLAGVAAAFEAAGPAPRVRGLLAGRLDGWHGEPAPLSRSWVDPLLAEVAPRDRAAAALALRVALAPHQVDESDVDACRHSGGTDADVVAVAGWAAFSAARHVVAWQHPADGRVRNEKPNEERTRT
jgi:AhpD family alkylhydroperoxidase